jgi:predicted dienelactone hydrolase
MQAARFLVAIALCLTAAYAQAAGLRSIEVAADAGGPALTGAMWSPCSQPPAEAEIGKYTLPGVKDCPIEGSRLPLVVISHGRGGSFAGHHDTAEALADAGFVVAAIDHPGDTASDLSRFHELSVYVTRPTDIKRLIDFMLGGSPAAAAIDPDRIGLFGFSRGGYTGLVAVGAEPHFALGLRLCEGSSRPVCEQIRNKDYPASLTHDARIKAAVVADPLSIFFDADSFKAVKAPVQVWQSQNGGDGVTPESVAAVEKNLPAGHDYHVVANAGHFAFLAPSQPALATARPELCTDAPGFDRLAFHKELNAAMLGFLRKHLTKP